MAESAPAAPSVPSSPGPSGGGSSTPGAGSTRPAASGSPAPGSTATPAIPAAPTRQKWKDTVDGKEVEFEADEAELRATFRKSRAADQRFEQAAQMRKEATQIQKAQAELRGQLKQDPRAVLKLLREQGVEDPLDFLAEALQGELAEEERLQDPNVRARVEAENKLKSMEQQFAEKEQRQQQEVFEQEVSSHTDRIVEVFDKALALVDLPADDDTLFFMAQLESVNRRRGLSITPERLAEEVRERVMGRGMKVLTSALEGGRFTGEKLLALNPGLTLKFREAIIEDYKKRTGKATEAAKPPPSSTGTRPAVKSEGELLTEKEAHEKREKELGRRMLRGL